MGDAQVNELPDASCGALLAGHDLAHHRPGNAYFFGNFTARKPVQGQPGVKLVLTVWGGWFNGGTVHYF